ncbi:MAG TPA: glutaminyl-peptide cyclotransferase [Acidobacteriaceae bacterium]|nr:glutaminyl-peptide cyclotransferase [Acidobacteriaceae bacterium]
MRKERIAWLVCLLLLGAVGCKAQKVDSYRVVHAYPHDSQAFTQGLIYLDGHLYESTGMNGRSSLREVNLETGRVVKEITVPSQYFAEGLTNWGSTLIQLTWKKNVAFVYDRATFRLLKTFHYPWEGWGLTQDGKHLIMSDGSETIHFLDPDTFKQVRSIHVTDRGKPVQNLNELEYIRGEIYANVWMSNRIARISPSTGKVLGWIDLSGILPSVEVTGEGAVLNGIAYDASHNRLFVTGKDWPRLFEIQVVKK